MDIYAIILQCVIMTSSILGFSHTHGLTWSVWGGNDRDEPRHLLFHSHGNAYSFTLLQSTALAAALVYTQVITCVFVSYVCVCVSVCVCKDSQQWPPVAVCTCPPHPSWHLWHNKTGLKVRDQRLNKLRQVNRIHLFHWNCCVHWFERIN